jgi:hypothetical protein
MTKEIDHVLNPRHTTRVLVEVADSWLIQAFWYTEYRMTEATAYRQGFNIALIGEMMNHRYYPPYLFPRLQPIHENGF